MIESSFPNVFDDDVLVSKEHMELSFRQLVARVIMVPTHHRYVSFVVRDDGSFCFGTSLWQAQPYVLGCNPGLGIDTQGESVDVWNFYAHWRRTVHSVLSVACAPSLLLRRIMETRSWAHAYLVEEIISNQRELDLSPRKFEYAHPRCCVRDEVLAVVNECCDGLLRYIQRNADSIDFSQSEWRQLYDVGMCVRKDFQTDSEYVSELFNLLDERLPTGETIEFRLRDIFGTCATVVSEESVGDDLFPLIDMFVDEFGVEDVDTPEKLHELLRVCCMFISHHPYKCIFHVGHD